MTTIAAGTQPHLKVVVFLLFLGFLLGEATGGGGNKACGLYVWDANQALRHRICSRLEAENIYHGKGGNTFVRIQHNSPLVRLWPCERHRTDACVICGRPRSEHVALPGLAILQRGRELHAAWKQRRKDEALASPFSTFVSMPRQPLQEKGAATGRRAKNFPALRELTCRQLVGRQIAAGKYNVTNATPDGEPVAVKMALANGAMTLILSDGESKERVQHALGITLPR